jgi:hypothetical protein
MLFLVFGSSAAGKTFALDALRDRVPNLAIHDFDELGVPVGADRAWRQRSNEIWLRRALDYQARGIDLLLAGQTPLGELLATPSALLVDGISACLVDCDDETRTARLQARGAEWLARAHAELDDYLSWAAWMRRHAEDPRWLPEVIVADDGLPEMRWDRWSGWQAGDPRWRVRVIDTSSRSVEQVSAAVAEWIAGERELLRSGAHPLAAWAARLRGDQSEGGRSQT